MQFLERLRSKKSHVKSQIAFASAIGVTGIIALVWLSTIPAQFSKIGEQIVQESDAQTATAGNAIDDLIAGATKSLDALDTEEEGLDQTEEQPLQTSESALDGLAGWRTSAEMDSFIPASATPDRPFVIEEKTTPTPTPTQPVGYTQTTEQNLVTTPAPTPAQPQPAVTPPPTQPVVSVPETTPVPTVILIGTTTKKTE
jgi:hypothetical protein